MREESIHKHSIGYNMLRAYVMFFIRLFYRRVHVTGRENIPYGSKLIINSNHQNALMDALVVLFAVNKSPIVFMARADIFKKKRQEKILTFLKMLPIYRMRDGAQELSKNEEIFERSVRIVADGTPLGLMPEGNHAGKRRLRNFVKGAFRIAFRTKEEVGEGVDVKILPIGIDYQHYQKFHQDVLINIGKPVSLQEFMPEYTENAPKGINSLRDKVSGEIKEMMIHISNEEVYDMYQNLRHIWNSRMKQLAGIRGKSLHDDFRADKLMIRILDHTWESNPESLKSLSGTTSQYMKNLTILNIRNWVVARKGYNVAETILLMLWLIITSPLALYGILNNILPYYLPVKLTGKIRDLQFVSSFKFVIATLMFTGFYLVQTLLAGFISGSALFAILYLISLPVSGFYALYWTFWVKKLKASLKFNWMNARKAALIIETNDLYVKIMETMESLCTKYLNAIPLKNKERYD